MHWNALHLATLDPDMLKPMQVGYSAILFYGYVGIIGIMLYACLRWWFKSKVSLAQVWCIYGTHANVVSC